MDSAKPLDFNASPLDYFVLSILSAVLAYIPFFGWAYLLNYSSSWMADRVLVRGKKVRYQASYGESLKFVTVGSLLCLITFGIYTFWFVPKMYHYVTDHITEADSVATPAAAAPVASPEPTDGSAATQPPVDPTAPAGPAS
jgi:hypothetical protein